MFGKSACTLKAVKLASPHSKVPAPHDDHSGLRILEGGTVYTLTGHYSPASTSHS